MDPDGLGRLTAKECEALRLVLSHRTAKAIANALGPEVTHYAVTERLRSARSKLQIGDSFAAARIYIQHVDGTARVEHPAVLTPFRRGIGDGEREHGPHGDNAVREARVPFGVPVAPAVPGPRLRLPFRRGKRDDVGPLGRLGWIAAIAAVTALLYAAGAVFFFGLYMTGMVAVEKLGWGLAHH